MVLFNAPFYNLHAAVGPSSATMRSDVFLVQYFIFFICIGSSKTWPGGFGPFGPTAPSDVNGSEGLFPFSGQFTPALGKWIRNFQTVANRRGFGPLTVDGAVHPAKVHWGHPPAGATGWFTIQALNHIMFMKNKDAFVSLANVDDVPAPVKEDIRRLMTN